MTLYATAADYFTAYLTVCEEFARMGHDPHAEARRTAHEARLEEEYHGCLTKPGYARLLHNVRIERKQRCSHI